MSVKGAAACWLVAGIAYVTLEAIAASAIPGYRYADDYISDLGRPDSPLRLAMNAGFVVQGTLFLLGAVSLTRGRGGRRTFIGFAAANAVGNVVVAIVPSGPSGIPWLHVGAATLAIVGGNAAVLAGIPFMKAVGAHRSYRVTSVVLAVLGLLSFALLAVGSQTAATVFLPSPVWERTSVYTIIAWQMLSAVVLLTRRAWAR